MKHPFIFLLLLTILGSLQAQESLYEVQIYRKANNTIATTIYLYVSDKVQCSIESLFALSDQNELFRPMSKQIEKLPEDKETAEALFAEDGKLMSLTNSEYILLTYFENTPTLFCKNCEGWTQGWAKCHVGMKGYHRVTDASLTRRPGLK